MLMVNPLTSIFFHSRHFVEFSFALLIGVDEASRSTIALVKSPFVPTAVYLTNRDFELKPRAVLDTYPEVLGGGGTGKGEDNSCTSNPSNGLKHPSRTTAHFMPMWHAVQVSQ